MKNNWKRKKIISLLGIIYAINFLIWIIDIVMVSLFPEVAIFHTFIAISSSILLIPVISGFFVSLGFVLYVFIKKIFKNTNIFLKLIAWIIIIGLINIMLGVFIVFLGTDFSHSEIDDEVKVIDLIDNKIIIDYTSYNFDDNSTLTIPKPFYAKVKPGDYIHVRFPSNNPQMMQYVVDTEVGYKFLTTGTVIALTPMYILIVALIFSVPYNLFIKKKNTSRNIDMKKNENKIKKRRAKRRINE